MAEVTSVEDVKPPTPVPGTEESEAALKNIERVLRELQRQRIEFVSNTKDITDSVDPAETLKQNAQKKVTRALHPFKSKNIKTPGSTGKRHRSAQRKIRGPEDERREERRGDRPSQRRNQQASDSLHGLSAHFFHAWSRLEVVVFFNHLKIYVPE